MNDLLIRGAIVIDGTGGAPRSVDVAVRDGRISAVEARRTETATREGDGPGRIVVQHYDSTAYVEMQDAARLRTRLIDEIDVAVVAGDLDGNVELWSRGAEKVFGWTAAEALGRQAAEIVIVDEDIAAAKAAVHALPHTGPRTTEREMKRKDGSRFSGYTTSSVYHDDHGAARGLISVIVDDTDRIRAAQDLREARDHLRAVTDSMGEALCTLDTAGHVSYMNAAAERLLGWSIDELRERTLHDAVHFRRADGSVYPIEECPLHGGQFNVCTGKAVLTPVEVDIRTYPVRLVEGRIEVQLLL